MTDRVLSCEGDTDRAVFRHIPNAQGYDILPDKPKPCTTRVSGGGNIRALEITVPLIRQGIPLVVTALDLDRGTPEILFARAERMLNEAQLAFTGAAGTYVVGSTRFHVIPVGLPGHPTLQRLGIRSHAIDDYLALLLHEQETYEELMRRERLAGLVHADFCSTLLDTVSFLRSKQVQVDNCKQVLDVARAIVGFRASPATLADRILQCAPIETAQAVLQPLIQALP